jgi:hypothetical protein
MYGAKGGPVSGARRYQKGGDVDDDRHLSFPTRPLVPPEARIRPRSSLQGREEQLMAEREQGASGALSIAEKKGGPVGRGKRK